MSICIFWERPDGGMTIESPGYEDKLRPPGDTDEALIARCIERTSRRLSEKYGGVSIPHEVEADTLPTAEFIDAWEWDSRAVVISMAKARGLHMDRIRMVRDGVLKKLDVTSLRAQEKR